MNEEPNRRTPAQPEPAAPRFPTMLRKMWSGGEVQAWIDEHWPAAAPTVVEPVAHCALTPAGKIAHFDGRPMVMIGSVGNEHHPTPLYAAAPPRAALTDAEIDEIWEWAPDYANDPGGTLKRRAFARAVIAADRGQG